MYCYYYGYHHYILTISVSGAPLQRLRSQALKGSLWLCNIAMVSMAHLYPIYR
jgi:hypothetical protein